MQIHQLTLPAKKSPKRIGRGGKRGASVDPLFEGGRSTFTERLKKVRGKKAVNLKKYTITLKALDKAFNDGETITVALLVERKVVTKKAIKAGVKVVATGTTKKKLTLGGGILFSESVAKILDIKA